MNQSVGLGLLITLFAGLFWRKLDGIDKRIETLEMRVEKFSDRLGNHTGDFREFKGKVEALLGSEKKHTEPTVEAHQ